MRIATSTYAAVNKNESIRLESSSGGIWFELASFVISNGGVVYGVAMSDDCLDAEFVRVINLDGLVKLRGSKYFQVEIRDTFKYIRNDLEKGLTVMFTGTGCQVIGLKSYLQKTYDNLICVDFICHGVPSPELWRRYVKNYEKNGKKKLLQ